VRLVFLNGARGCDVVVSRGEDTGETEPAYETSDIPTRSVFQILLLFLLILAVIIGGLYWIYSGEGTQPPARAAAGATNLPILAV